MKYCLVLQVLQVDVHSPQTQLHLNCGAETSGNAGGECPHSAQPIQCSGLGILRNLPASSMTQPVCASELWHLQRVCRMHKNGWCKVFVPIFGLLLVAGLEEKSLGNRRGAGGAAPLCCLCSRQAFPSQGKRQKPFNSATTHF